MSKKKTASTTAAKPVALECPQCGFRDVTLTAEKCPTCWSKLKVTY